uniref:Uncharacterized protein n=1 Tax=Quercus lobata TaxID=97700 RepID=A0A7N2R4R3_QUELO
MVRVLDFIRHPSKRERQLVTKIPSSNRDWKEKFFFVPGSDWACRPDEVAIAEPVDYTWGILPKSEMEAGAAKKNKRVQEVTALAAAAIKEGKLQLSKPGDRRKFGVDTSPKPFGTITHPKETPSHPSMTPSRLASVECPRAPSRGKGPLTPPKPPLLINDATYAVEQVKSIIKEEDIDDCDKYAPTTIEESGLHDLAKVVMRMKTLELWCRDYEDQMVNL